jgi:putative ABC transport system substrate-binding protein
LHLGLAAWALVFFALVPALEAQTSGKTYRVGILTGLTVAATAPNVEAFRRRLGELGYRERENLTFEYRGPQGRLPELAAELLRLKVDVIFAVASDAALAAKDATKTTPIVFAFVGDPVGIGVVASLARPGGNVTGVTHIPGDIMGKRLGLLKEAVPSTRQVTVLTRTRNPSDRFVMHAAEAAADSLGVKLEIVDLPRPEDVPVAFSTIRRGNPDALLVTLAAPVTPAAVTEFAMKARLPSVYERRDFVEAGGLMSYGIDFIDHFRGAATVVDKILKGAKPADLPVEQPTKFELVINVKTARALGLTIPQSLLLRADQVIE